MRTIQSGPTYDAFKFRLSTGKAKEKALVASVQQLVIRDRLVSPRATFFHVQEGGSGKVGLSYGREEGMFTIHRHAYSQLLQKVGFPATYSASLQNNGAWGTELLVHNLNTLYHQMSFASKGKQDESKFLHRIVGGELRGFLSRRFNRHLASAPLLAAFVSACGVVGAEPVESSSTAVKNRLTCIQPLLYEPVPGVPVCLGTEWSNSDFGSGRLQVSLVVWRPNGGQWVVDNGMSRVHIGSVLEDSDMEISDETAHKEVIAQSSAIRDAVREHLKPASVERILKAIELASQGEIQWASLRGQLSKFLTKAEVEEAARLLTEEVEDLPPVTYKGGNAVVPPLWAMSVLDRIASRETDDDRKADIQRKAGAFLSVNFDD